MTTSGSSPRFFVAGDPDRTPVGPRRSLISATVPSLIWSGSGVGHSPAWIKGSQSTTASTRGLALRWHNVHPRVRGLTGRHAWGRIRWQRDPGSPRTGGRRWGGSASDPTYRDR